MKRSACNGKTGAHKRKSGNKYHHKADHVVLAKNMKSVGRSQRWKYVALKQGLLSVLCLYAVFLCLSIRIRTCGESQLLSLLVPEKIGVVALSCMKNSLVNFGV